jgi:RNA polymerase sigma-70 factor (ECF subfamily)
MQDSTATFEHLRPRLMAIGYRMLASVQEAEDLVQDAWVRWHEDEGRLQHDVQNTEAWLVTMTTRMAIDRLRAAKVRRDAYPGFWLPEPWEASGPQTPEQTRELADSVSVAFLMLLERLTPESRAAFLLREVFDADYKDVAKVIGKSEAAARQVVSRAKAQLRDEKPAPAIKPALQLEVLRGFADALSRGDFHGLQALLAEQSELLSDGGGIVPSFGKALIGARRIAQLYWAAYLKHGERMRVELTQLNGQWALLRYLDGQLESAQSFVTDGERIVCIHIQRNPNKLERISSRD